MEDAKRLKRRLTQAGKLSTSTVDLAWPAWWSNDADSSLSAQTELRFSLARKLGLDPVSLMDEGQPVFLWSDESKFKNFREKDRDKQPAIAAFGASVSKMLLRATEPSEARVFSAPELRAAILRKQRFVKLSDLLAFCWGIGIPVVHLRVFPVVAKHMCAMAVRVGDRFAILIAQDATYPARIAFFLAHEIGHIMCGHLASDGALVDMDDPLELGIDADDEEKEADAFALELLTGVKRLDIIQLGEGRLARELADHAQSAADHGIEPGTFALCYGHSTGNWPTANGALRYIYSEKKDVWPEINKAAMQQLSLNRLPDDLRAFLGAVLGGISL